MSAPLSRRALVTAAAWSVPVIALAVAAPAAAASAEPPTPPVTCGGSQQDNGTYTVTDDLLVISYRQRPDLVDINIQYADGTQHPNIHLDASVVPASLVFVVALRSRPSWIQVHGFNAHFGADCR